MFVGTHASLPFIIAGLHDLRRAKHGLPPAFSRGQLFCIALGGLLPDLFNIHISIAARHASFTHTAWFPGILLAFGSVFFLPILRKHLLTAVIAWVGVLLHIGCDLIAGGVPLFGVGNPVVGAYYVPPYLWLPLDDITILAAWYIFLYSRFLRSGGTLACDTCNWEEAVLRSWREEHQTKEAATRPGLDLPAVADRIAPAPVEGKD